MENLNLQDRKILSVLDKNARASYSEIGRKTRIAKETVKYRINNMMERNIIEGFYSVINFTKLGIKPFRLYLRLKDATPEKEGEILDYLKASPEIGVLFRVDGPFNFALGIWIKNVWEFERFWNDFKTKYGMFLGEYHLSFMTMYTEFSRGYLYPEEEKKEFSIFGESEEVEINRTDYELLSLISNNARVSLTAIARGLDVSIVTARSRLKNLIKEGVIIGFRPMINMEKLGYHYYKVDTWIKDFGKLDEIRSYVLSLPNVVYTENTLVTSDFEFDLEVKDSNEFVEIMDRIKERFPEDIRDYRYYSRIRAFKTVFFIPGLLGD